MGVSGAAGLGQNIRQTTGLLSRWWSLAYDGEWFPRFLAARSMLGTARVVVTFWCAVFVALAVLAQFVKGGATELPERLAAGAACMIALYCCFAGHSDGLGRVTINPFVSFRSPISACP